MSAPWEEPTLFDIPACPPRRVKSARDLARELRPTWVKYTGPHQPCGRCQRELHDAGGAGPLPAAARFTRAVKATGDRILLCQAHTEVMRKADELARAGAR